MIVRQSEIEPMLQAMVASQRPAIEQGEYLPIGTLDRADWPDARKRKWSPAETVERAWLFKDHWNFRVTGGWRPADD